MRQLRERGSSLDAVDAICQSPALHAEAAALAPRLLAMMTPAGPEGVRSVLGEMFALYPQPDRSQAEWTAWWSAYVEDLEEIPEWALIEARRDYRRRPDAEYFPKPGILRTLAGKRASFVVQSLARVRMAARQEPRRQIEVISPEQRHLVAEEIRASVRGVQTL